MEPPPPSYENSQMAAGKAPMPPGAFQQPYPQPPVAQQVIVTTSYYGRHPVQVQCPHCQNTVVTHTERNLKSSACCLACCLFFFTFLFCFWVPLVMDSSYEVIHMCPKCKKFLARCD